MTTALILWTLDAEGVGTLTLNRPDKLNALSLAMLTELETRLLEAQRLADVGDLRVLILNSSSPKAFCVGADLDERLKMNEEQVVTTLDQQLRIMNGLAALAIPTLAVIEGLAFGGGLELALAADLRIACATAQLALSETRLAIIPGAGGTQRLTRLVGSARAKELIFMAKRLSGHECENIGLVNKTDAAPLAIAQSWAREILKAGPLAIRAAKRAIDGGIHLEMSEALLWERSCYESTLKSADRLEGLRSFHEKRTPVYKGK